MPATTYEPSARQHARRTRPPSALPGLTPRMLRSYKGRCHECEQMKTMPEYHARPQRIDDHLFEYAQSPLPRRSRSGACPHRHSTRRYAARGASGGVGPPARDSCNHPPRNDERGPQGASFVVDPVHRYSNNSMLLPPHPTELNRLAATATGLRNSIDAEQRASRRVRRRLEPAFIEEITEQYRAGATTPGLCKTYGLSKPSMLRLLREEGVELRRRPLADEQVAIAVEMYAFDQPIAAIATHLHTGYNNVRQRLIKAGTQLRPRGGNHYRTTRTNSTV